MSCEQTHCSSHSFSVCKNHCMKQLCLEHLIEHEDFFLNQRRHHELNRLQTSHSLEESQVEHQYTFLTKAQQLFDTKNEQLKKSFQENKCFINQHDFEQIKSYQEQLKQLLDR